MIETIIIFVTGVICGIAASQIRMRLMKNQVRFYESYIHRRLEETVPRIREQLSPH